MYNHLYNLEWSNTNCFNDHSKEYKYRCVILKNGLKVHDEIRSIWSLRLSIVNDLVRSWNRKASVHSNLEYIYYLI